MFTALKGGPLRGLRLDRRLSERIDIDPSTAAFQEMLTSDGQLLLGPESAAEWLQDHKRRESDSEFAESCAAFAKWFKRLIACAGLDSREKEVITLRYGADGTEPKTQKQIAKKFGVTRRRIGQIEKNAREKIERHARQKWLPTFP
jgi:RNA polymerase sigma factor (sigma-70 family)